MLKAVSNSRHQQAGVSLIEVLVSVVIVVLGLLGLAGLQSHATVAEMEAFQRAQALVLLQDMVDRINANRKLSMQYVTAAPLGTGNAIAACAGTIALRDLCEWQNALLGAAESSGTGAVGAMIGARGCIVRIDAQTYMVTIAWQGLSRAGMPVETCGQGAYGNDENRRTVSTIIRLALLAA